jgi:putative flippase GtrA
MNVSRFFDYLWATVVGAIAASVVSYLLHDIWLTWSR